MRLEATLVTKLVPLRHLDMAFLTIGGIRGIWVLGGLAEQLGLANARWAAGGGGGLGGVRDTGRGECVGLARYGGCGEGGGFELAGTGGANHGVLGYLELRSPGAVHTQAPRKVLIRMFRV